MDILLIGVGVILVVFYSWYVSLVKRRNQAREALSSVDVQLRKRHNVLPNVLKISSKFLQHETRLLKDLTNLRGEAMASYNIHDPESVSGHLKAESELQAGMTRFFALAENYPALTSSETMITAQHTYSEIEGHISAARRFYNASVTRLNNAVEIFPGSLIASLVHVKTMPFFEIVDEAVRQPVDANSHLGSSTASHRKAE